MEILSCAVACVLLGAQPGNPRSCPIPVGTWQHKADADGWTARTVDGTLAAHFENSEAVTANGPWVLGK